MGIPPALTKSTDPLFGTSDHRIANGSGFIPRASLSGKVGQAQADLSLVDKYREGNNVLLQFRGDASVVKELERRLRVSDVVLNS